MDFFFLKTHNVGKKTKPFMKFIYIKVFSGFDLKNKVLKFWEHPVYEKGEKNIYLSFHDKTFCCGSQDVYFPLGNSQKDKCIEEVRFMSP